MIQRKKLGEIANISAGQGAPQGAENYSEEGTPFVKAGDLFYLVNGERECDIQKVSEEVAKNHRLKLYPKGTVLFAKSGMSCMKGYVYATNAECYVVSHLACIMPFDVDSKYLKYYFEYHKPNQLVKDASYPSISLADIAEMPINVFDDQTEAKIVDNLDAVNSLIAKSKEELGLLDNIVKSRFVEMFGENVPTVRLGSVCQMINGDRGKNYPSGEDFVPMGVPFVNAGHLHEGRVDFSSMNYITEEKYALLSQGKMRKNDILYCLRGSLGKHGLVDFERGAVASSLVILRCNEQRILPQFLFYAIETPEIEKQLKAANNGSSQPNLSAASVKAYNIKLPSINKQTEFAAFVAEVDKSKLSYEMEVAA